MNGKYASLTCFAPALIYMLPLEALAIDPMSPARLTHVKPSPHPCRPMLEQNAMKATSSLRRASGWRLTALPLPRASAVHRFASSERQVTLTGSKRQPAKEYIEGVIPV